MKHRKMRHRNLFNLTKLLTFAIALTVGLFPAGLSAAEETTVVTVSAPSEVDTGEQFTVSIEVEPGTAIAGDINNTTGSISGVAGAIITPGQTVSTSGTFATITLTAGTTGGTCSFTLSGVVVGDSNGQPVSISVVSGQTTVNGEDTTNQAPVLETIGDQSVEEEELLEFVISATDPDDDPLTFSADNLPDGADFNPETQIFSWTPQLGEADIYAVHFEVSDGELSDSENIIITVTTPAPPGGGAGDVGDDDPGGGGGGDIGGSGSEPPADEPDETTEDTTPPVIDEVTTSDVGTDSVVIRWTTTEPSTSQVEYWASPSQFSPLDETLVTEHQVHLVGLNPGTNYHYRTMSRDGAGNLVTSSEYDFTTSGEPATFVVSWLTISPAEAYIDQEVTVNALITNIGDTTGSHDVTLSINGTAVDTESIINLAGGESQLITFNITREIAGDYTVDINGTMDTLIINEATKPETVIGLFNIIPYYESDTGVITSATIYYGIHESYYSTLFSQLDTELVLKVGLGSESLEEVILIAAGQPEPDTSTGSLSYVPAEGWMSGTYTFQLELRTGDGVIETCPPVRLIITPAVAASVTSWATLGEIIGGALIIAQLLVLLILHRNRDMLRAQSLE
jgi:hypothetical protein